MQTIASPLVITGYFICPDVDWLTPCLSSDHYFVSFALRASQIRLKIKPPPHDLEYSMVDIVGLTDYMYFQNFEFFKLLFYNNIEFLWSSVKCIIQDAVSQFTCRTKSRRGLFPKWSPSVWHHLNQIHSLRKKSRKSPFSLNCTKLSHAEQILKDDLQTAEAVYELNLIRWLVEFQELQHLQIYSSLNHTSLNPFLHFNSTQAVTDTEKANLLNNYFSSNFNCSSFYLPSPSTIPIPQETLSKIDTSVSDVYTALASIDDIKTKGIDEMHPRILKIPATALCKPIHHLFTLCLSHSYLPTWLAYSQYHSNPQAVDKTSTSNYRPISLLCVLSKVLESIVYNHITDISLGSNFQVSVWLSTWKVHFNLNT